MASSRGRRRDRQVYLRSHPALFLLLAATRGVPVLPLGRTLLVNGTDAYVDALTRVPLDRTAANTTGGTARRLTAGGLLFDQDGAAHRTARRELATGLGADGVARLRPLWTAVLQRRLAPLRDGQPVELVELAAELAAVSAAALLGSDADPALLAAAARAAASAAVRQQLPGWGRRTARRRTALAVERLTALLPGSTADVGLAGMLAVAAITTTVAALPRAVAWCADDGLWNHAADPQLRPVLVAELLRVTAPSPVLPRAAAGAGRVGGRPVRAGDRLVLVARHAAASATAGPDATAPAPARTAALVFGAGTHTCPGARLARSQLADVLAALAPYRPVVVSARVDRAAALPSWGRLLIRPGRR